MHIFPAIDIRDGKCVRLTQGDYQKEHIYHDDPLEVAKNWEKAGAQYLHIVDLDGAKSGKPINHKVIQTMAEQVTIPIQVGGGIRSLKSIDDYLKNGVERVIIGSAAVLDWPFLTQMADQFASQLAVSIDARNGYVATNGWLETSHVKATDLVADLEQLGIGTIIYTDILKDGMLNGPNFIELATINQQTSSNIIASGGITTACDVKKLTNLDLYGAIIGKALYDGTLPFSKIREEYDHD